jgi:hypothetical protein
MLSGLRREAHLKKNVGVRLQRFGVECARIATSGIKASKELADEK